MTYKTELVGKLSMRGAFEVRNAAREVIKVIEFSGSVPLGMNAEQAQQEQTEKENGPDDQQ